ncbi:MAG: rubrerythrin family protein [Candidatus Aminicenantes bacterium]|nr:rubrerythrin family protein [Candidatus Aminicenantes bacterium]
MKEKSEKNLNDAFAGESQAHIKYMAFGAKAEQENMPNVARIFRANSYAEQIHATNHLRTLSGIQSTSENLKGAIEGETYEVEEMYPAFIKDAQEEQEPAAERMNAWALAAEEVHARLYKKAKSAVDGGQDVDLESIHVCQVCGFTMEGDAPDICPVCGTPKSRFTQF